MSANLEHIQQVMAEADILFTADEVQTAVEQVAAQINQQLCNSNPVVLLFPSCYLKYSNDQMTILLRYSPVF